MNKCTLGSLPSFIWITMNSPIFSYSEKNTYLRLPGETKVVHSFEPFTFMKYPGFFPLRCTISFCPVPGRLYFSVTRNRPLVLGINNLCAYGSSGYTPYRNQSYQRIQKRAVATMLRISWLVYVIQLKRLR